MKNALKLVPLAIALIALSGAALAQTADEIIEKNLAAMGGRDALGKVKSRTVTGTITLSTPAGEISGPVSQYNQAPNKSRVHIKLDLKSFGQGEVSIDQRFDGTSGIVLDSTRGDREITGKQLENSRNNFFPTPYLNYKELGATVELLGKEKVGDREAYVLQYTAKGGSPIKQFIDAETFLLFKAVSKAENPQLGEIEQTTEFSDYREVDSVKIPFQVKSSNAAQSFTITVSQVENNTEIDNAMFSKPAGEKPSTEKK